MKVGVSNDITFMITTSGPVSSGVPVIFQGTFDDGKNPPNPSWSAYAYDPTKAIVIPYNSWYRGQYNISAMFYDLAGTKHVTNTVSFTY